MGTLTLVTDRFSGGSAVIEEWDFRSMNKCAFKTRFEASIQQPLRELLNEFNRNPNVQLPFPLRASMLGLIRGLAVYYQFTLSQSRKQTEMNLRGIFGSNKPPQVGFIYFESVRKVRKACLSITDTERELPFVLSPRSLEEMESTFAGPAFASQRITLGRGAILGVSFPLLLCWKLAELVPTNCPDTFLEPKIVSLRSEVEIGADPPPAPNQTPSYQFLVALRADEALLPYAAETCALCRNSGVEGLSKCSKCRVAQYCGRQHQIEHWSEHKKHCKRLRDLKKCIFETNLH